MSKSLNEVTIDLPNDAFRDYKKQVIHVQVGDCYQGKIRDFVLRTRPFYVADIPGNKRMVLHFSPVHCFFDPQFKQTDIISVYFMHGVVTKIMIRKPFTTVEGEAGEVSNETA